MTDEEIPIKRLSDWKPESDIKLQKAFGKFVEETGELLVEIASYHYFDKFGVIPDLENELADCDALIQMIEQASEGKVSFNFNYDFHISHWVEKHSERVLGYKFDAAEALMMLVGHIGRSLSIVGRCQIQGLNGNHPETGKSNIEELAKQLGLLRSVINYSINFHKLDKDRIEKRKQAKIDSKLPWIMGTATDLLPST